MVKQLDESTDVAAEDAVLAAAVREAIASVHDPEIPPLSIVELGIVQDVRITADALAVDLLPTFAGCPALDAIREDVTAALRPVAGDRRVEVRFLYSPPWTSDRITPEGREALRAFGLTPPTGHGPAPGGPVPIRLGRRVPVRVTCPFCGSDETVLESAFGPTLCRSVHFCSACRNPFEAFKPKRTG